ncbi:MAG: signal transduction histidine kinase, nitrogen specific, NtrB [Verrucomicrobiales bacterium]|nr:signal transduction histidine kinase, nitrogen specific, NtrB [Verrucomicrobiales bacterium]
MTKKIRILHLEDNSYDAELIHSTIEAEGMDCEFTHVKNRQEFESAIDGQTFDLILSDYAVPDYDGFAALKFARAKNLLAPFILLSGTLGEEQAVESLKNGAADYILKQRLIRLGPAISRALAEAQERAERKRGDERILEQAMLLDKAHDAILVCDLAGRITSWNKGAERIYGWNVTEAVGKTIQELLSAKDSDRIEQAQRDVIAKGEWIGELTQFIKSGKTVIVQSHWTCPRDHADQPTSVLVINTDITEKKQIEEQYLRAQRLESIGILASGIAHDLNNVLAPVLMGAQLLRMTVTDPEAIGPLDAIESSAQHGAELIKQILAFGRGVGGERIELQVGHLIRDVHKLVRETFPRSIEVQVNVAKDLWLVKAVSTQVHQILMNLCVNARDAMPEGGRLQLRAENLYVDENYVASRPETKPGSYVIITVSDTGTGMPPEILQRIYDPFFTTKEIGKGTGLGLSTVKGIVKNHEGFIHVYSEMNKGTQFRVYLPAASSASVKDVEHHQQSLPHGKGECILVVDDEENVRRVTATILERCGYYTLLATDGAEGLATYVAHQQDVKLVITDMMMPLMGGAPLIRALRRINPDVKMIALSGMVDSIDPEAVAGVELMSKPFSAEQLLVAVRRAIDEVK